MLADSLTKSAGDPTDLLRSLYQKQQISNQFRRVGVETSIRRKTTKAAHPSQTPPSERSMCIKHVSANTKQFWMYRINLSGSFAFSLSFAQILGSNVVVP